MKTKHIFTTCAIFAFTAISGADATPFDVYANGITIRNIAAMQHSIATNTIQTFEGTMAAALGNRARITQTQVPAPQEPAVSRAQYGQMPVYGEYNDDGSAYGRSGGDITAPFSSFWANWQHFDGYTKLDDIERIDTDYDLVAVELAGDYTQRRYGVSQWGLYGGYAGGTQKNQSLDIDESGGFLGIYSGYNIGNFNISATVNGGAMFSDATSDANTNDYSNAWVGAMVHGAYNIAIDDTLTLQPSLYAGYTWIKSDDYTLGETQVKNRDLNTFEIIPEIRAIKHIGAGWFGTANVRYVATWENGGDITVNDAQMDDLAADNYTEYSLGLEKSIDRFNIMLHIGRRDGGQSGWIGGTSFKYIF